MEILANQLTETIILVLTQMETLQILYSVKGLRPINKDLFTVYQKSHL